MNYVILNSLHRNLVLLVLCADRIVTSAAAARLNIRCTNISLRRNLVLFRICGLWLRHNIGEADVSLHRNLVLLSYSNTRLSRCINSDSST
jgi:hypothetical protein